MAVPTPAGYSGTPLAAKLGIKAGHSVHLVAPPSGYRSWLAPLPDKVTFQAQLSATTDLVHAFFTSRAAMARALTVYRGQLRPDAAIWVSWPKKTSGVATDITEDVIRTVALPLGFVDIKVCAVSEVWSGLKLVIRKELR